MDAADTGGLVRQGTSNLFAHPARSDRFYQPNTIDSLFAAGFIGFEKAGNGRTKAIATPSGIAALPSGWREELRQNGKISQ